MTNKLKEFLNQKDIQEALENYDFEYIYNQFQKNSSISPSSAGEFSELMISLGYNPLNYMDLVPKYFLSKTKIKEFKIPNHIKTIEYGAFYRCSSLTSVTVSNSVTSIGEFAFFGCSSLTSITIPNSVTSIRDSAFGHCTSLTNITIPNSVKSIGD